MEASLTELVGRYKDQVVPHLRGDALDMVKSDVFSGDEWLLVEDCLHGALLSDLTIPLDLLALTEAEVRKVPQNDRTAATLEAINQHKERHTGND